MSEYFTSVTFEVSINGVWIDISADVLKEPAPHLSRGISSNEILDSVGDGGALTFSLNNSVTNSAGLVGYYSPGHANVLSGWRAGLPVRLSFTYDTWTVRKWFGRIEPSGIKVIPGTLNERRVDVVCEDFMAAAARHKMNLVPAQVNKTFAEAMHLITNNMPIRPQAIYYDDGQYGESTAPPDGITPFPLLFDISSAETMAIGEFQKLANSSSGYIAAIGDMLNGETLYAIDRRGTTAENPFTIPDVTAEASNIEREDNTDHILLESGDIKLREGGSKTGGDSLPAVDDSDIIEMSTSYGKDIANYVTITTTPRRTDATATSSVLWTLQKAIYIEAGESTTIRANYTDPTGGSKVNGLSFTNPVANTDYKANAAEDGTGTDLTSSVNVYATFGAADAEIYIKNNHATDRIYIGGATAGAFLRIRGQGVFTYDQLKEVYTEPTSIARYGIQPLNIDSKYSSLNEWLSYLEEPYGQYIAGLWAEPLTSVDSITLYANRDTKNMRYFMFVEPLMNITVTEEMNALSNVLFIVMGYEADIITGAQGKIYVPWTLTLKRNV